MKTTIQITRDKIDGRPALPAAPGCGAVVEFCGVVRAEEAGVTIEALEYEAYEPMVTREIERILTDLGKLHPCAVVEVIHRIGRIPAGEAAIVVRVEAKHRAGAFRLLEEFMNRLKQDVPIWKKVP
jgi:molybdopterin synthase catalytic subunit